MALDDSTAIHVSSKFHVILQIWEATTAKGPVLSATEL